MVYLFADSLTHCGVDHARGDWQPELDYRRFIGGSLGVDQDEIGHLEVLVCDRRPGAAMDKRSICFTQKQLSLVIVLDPVINALEDEVHRRGFSRFHVVSYST